MKLLMMPFSQSICYIPFHMSKYLTQHCAVHHFQPVFFPSNISDQVSHPCETTRVTVKFLSSGIFCHALNGFQPPNDTATHRRSSDSRKNKALRSSSLEL
jgi:hypothetical protein